MPADVLRRAPHAPALAPRRVRLLAERMLSALDLEQAELSVLLTDDETIHGLNRAHRGKDRPTDVLAFPLEAPSEAERPCLGDVVISLDTALRQARGRRRTLLEEVRFLLAHGLLHLLGYDHATPAQKRTMDALTRRLVRHAQGEAKHQGSAVTIDARTRKLPRARGARKTRKSPGRRSHRRRNRLR